MYKEGVLLTVVMERGELSLSKFIENKKQLTVSTLLHTWESVLTCIAALHHRLAGQLQKIFLLC